LQPSARTAQKTLLSSQSVGALLLANNQLLSLRFFRGCCLATGLYATVLMISAELTRENFWTTQYLFNLFIYEK
jgi:hypothetical protein